MIGKYDRVSNCAVVAVSDKGFSTAARKKAEAYGIQTLTIRQALDTDWPSDAFRAGFDVVTSTYSLTAIVWDFDGSTPETVKPEMRIRDAEGVDRGTIGQFVNKSLASKIFPELKAHIDQNFLTIFKDLADFDKVYDAEQRVTPGGRSLCRTRMVRSTRL